MLRCLVLFLCWPAFAVAQETVTARFDVRFGPLRVAEITMVANETDGAYSAAGRVMSTGLAGVFRDIRFDLSAEGTREGAAFLPLAYREDVNTGRRISQVVLEYLAGIPVVVSAAPAREAGPWTIDATDQSGTVDPMSALYRLARPRPLEELCDWSVDVFDGRRRSLLVLGPADEDDGLAYCYGEYRRVAGFSPEEMEHGRHFPFAVEFEQLPAGLWRLTRVETQTTYGRVRIIGRF